MLYGSECWTVKADLWWIDALDQRCLQRILDIHCHDFVRNADVHHITNQPPLSSIIKSRRLSFWTSCENGCECRRQPSYFWACFWELETSTWAAMYYLDEDHPRWSLFRGSGAAWSQRSLSSVSCSQWVSSVIPAPWPRRNVSLLLDGEWLEFWQSWTSHLFLGVPADASRPGCGGEAGRPIEVFTWHLSACWAGTSSASWAMWPNVAVHHRIMWSATGERLVWDKMSVLVTCSWSQRTGSESTSLTIEVFV